MATCKLPNCSILCMYVCIQMDSLVFDYIYEKLDNVQKDPSDAHSFNEAISSLEYTDGLSDFQKNILFTVLVNTKRSIPTYLENIFSVETEFDHVCVCMDVPIYYSIERMLINFTNKVDGFGIQRVLSKLDHITFVKTKISNIEKLDTFFGGKLYPEYKRFLTDCCYILDDMYVETDNRIGIEHAFDGIDDE